MSAAIHHLELNKGTAFSKILNLQDSQGNQLQTDGATVILKVQNGNGASVSEWSTANGMITHADSGKLIIEVPSNIITGIGSFGGTYVLQITYANGSSQPLLQGRINIR